MTFQEILEGITRHRANPVIQGTLPSGMPNIRLEQKINEIEWALQALAEKLADSEGPK